MKLTNAELQNLYYTYRPDEWAKDYIEPENDIVLDEWQKSFLTDDRRRILLLIHRQGGKSTAVAIKAVHRAVFRDDQTILLFSPTQRQSSELFYNVRKMIKSVPDYENLLTVDNVTSLELTNGSRIISLPGTNWNIRGYRADMVIIDEAAGVPDEVFDAVSPMLLTTNGQFIQLSTPNKKKGAFYNSYQSEAWGRYTVKVSDNPRMQTPDKQQFLKAELTDRGSRVYSQEYECEFLSNIEGGTFNRSWYRFVDDPMNGQYKVRYWDLAASETRGDWVSATKMSMTDGEYCIEHSIHFQGTAKEVKDLLISTCEKEGEYMSVVIELEGGSESK
ncbi:MAG: terminase family protein, partial [Clostridia bacterium]